MSQIEDIHFIELLQERDKALDEGIARNTKLAIENIAGKRALLIGLMTISAAIIAGLFLLFASRDVEHITAILATVSGIILALFVLSATIYLVALLSYESIQINSRLDFGKSSKRDFIDAIGTTIIDVATYKKFGEAKAEEEKALFPEEELFFTSEWWFWGIISIFPLSLLFLIVTFISTVHF